MLISSSGRMWFGSAVLSGLLLVSSFPAPNTSHIAATNSKSAVFSTLTKVTYPKTVRSQLNWNTDPISSQSVNDASTIALSPDASKTINVVMASSQAKSKAETQAPIISPRPVETAATTQKQEVSRSDSSLIVGHALSLQGVPYYFGGTSRSGFDCSGFTQYVFRASNITLPRTSAGQFNIGTSVNRGELKGGDLVFFSTYSSGPSHVGIYIGGGRFVHASNSGVRITSLSDSYYTGRYLGARRVN